MNRLSELIVDDEPLVRQRIRRGLSALEGIGIIGECGSGLEATAAILSQRPDLVLLDVQLQDSTGLDVVAQIGPQNMPPVIFITAYDEYAVKALNSTRSIMFPNHSMDERLSTSIGRAQERIAARKQNFLGEQLEALLDLQRKRWPERIV
jgi:two-component system, LytTR family, response regulator